MGRSSSVMAAPPSASRTSSCPSSRRRHVAPGNKPRPPSVLKHLQPARRPRPRQPFPQLLLQPSPVWPRQSQRRAMRPPPSCQACRTSRRRMRDPACRPRARRAVSRPLDWGPALPADDAQSPIGALNRIVTERTGDRRLLLKRLALPQALIKGKPNRTRRACWASRSHLLFTVGEGRFAPTCGKRSEVSADGAGCPGGNPPILAAYTQCVAP